MTPTRTEQSLAKSRRGFLETSAAFRGGLMVGVVLPMGGAAQDAGLMHTPSAWAHIADDNTITLISARAEIGQGVCTSMPMLIAEELDVDIQKAKVAFAPPGKVNGTALFGIDVKLPGMVCASIEMSPVQGGKVRSFDARKAKAAKGVVDGVQLPDGVAVVADTCWRAVSHNMNAFANETFIDECAVAAGKDPLAYRLSLPENQPQGYRRRACGCKAAGPSGFGAACRLRESTDG